MDAEIVASILIEKLGNLISNESTTIRSTFKGQVQTAINGLHLLKKSLQEIEDYETLTGRSMSHLWFARLLQAVYSAEDSTDTLLTRTELRQRKKQNRFNRFMRFTSLWSQILFTYEMRKLKREIRGLSSRAHCIAIPGTVPSDVQDVVCNNNNKRLSLQLKSYNLQQCGRWSRISSFCLEEETDVVGLERKIQELVVRLIPEDDRIDDRSNEEIMEVPIPEQDHNNDQSGEVTVEVLGQDRDQSTRVIAVVGEGGSGKTTLVRAVYSRVDVKRHFTKRVWVRVPTIFKARDVLDDIIEQIQEDEFVVNDATTVEKDLIFRINQLLSWTRYLLVMDNVDRPQVWEALRGALGSSCRGSRIIIISRNGNNVLSDAANSTVHVHRLNNEESWKLFSKKVRIADDHVLNNSELITLKEKILNTCKGSPLVIVLLAALLSTRELSYDEWSKVIERANSLRGNIFALSYQDLPSQVKPCFLYVGLFPREFGISVRRLIHLWSAEGFVTPLGPDEDLDPEDVAENYFEELVIRNMIQVTWRLDGNPKTCCMPNLLHDFFSAKAENVGFFHHLLPSSHTSAKHPEFTARRLAAVALSNNKFPYSFLHGQHLRSYLAFDRRILGTPAVEIDIFLSNIISKGGFALMKVLDLEGVYKPVLSKATVGKLLYLKYLSLRCTAIDYLPDSVGSLSCLETLDMKHTNIRNLPPSTWEAKKLRHLYLNWTCSCIFTGALPPDPPPNLQTIWGLHISDVSGVDFLKRSVTVRKLGLRCASTLTNEEIPEYVSQQTQLQSLKLRSFKDHFDIPPPKLHSMAEHHKLQELYLFGELLQPNNTVKIDFRHFFPPNLRVLTLSGSGLEDDPMPMLGLLPQLNILRLFVSAFETKEIKCLSGGFLKLHVLKLWNLWLLKEWTVDEGAMPCLRELEIRDCPDLQQLTGLQHVTNLKEIVLTNMPTTFRASVAQSLLGRNIYIKSNPSHCYEMQLTSADEIQVWMNAFDPDYEYK